MKGQMFKEITRTRTRACNHVEWQFRGLGSIEGVIEGWRKFFLHRIKSYEMVNRWSVFWWLLCECGVFSLQSTMAFSLNPSKVTGSTMELQLPLVQQIPIKASRKFLPPICCAPFQLQVDSGIMCEPCSGRGWLICDFCKGQKTNVRSETSRVYRRCPSCRAVGYILCSKCKVFKCVTFPDHNDGVELIL